MDKKILNYICHLDQFDIIQTKKAVHVGPKPGYCIAFYYRYAGSADAKPMLTRV